METVEIIVTAKLHGSRLDTLVKERLPWLTNTQLDCLINDGSNEVNEKRIYYIMQK